MTARPGDRQVDRAAMLRVDQAGEYGATRIYAGQLAVLAQWLARGARSSRAWRARRSATWSASTR